MQAINIDQIQKDLQHQASSSKPSNTPTIARSSASREAAESLTEKLWPKLISMYGRTFTSQYGATPDETWISCLVGVSGAQVGAALNQCLVDHPEWPPGAAQFRSLCVGHDEHFEDELWQHRRQAAAAATSAQLRLGVIEKDQNWVNHRNKTGLIRLSAMRQQVGL